MGGPVPASSRVLCLNTVDQGFPRPDRLTAIWKTTQLLPAPGTLRLFSPLLLHLSFFFSSPSSFCQDAILLMSFTFSVVHFQEHNEPCVHNLKTKQPFLCIDYWVNHCAYVEVPKIDWQVQRHSTSKVFCHNGLSTGHTMKESENIQPMFLWKNTSELLTCFRPNWFSIFNWLNVCDLHGLVNH